MIVSNKRKFIFIHCRKTGGSSVAVALAKYLGPNDLQLSAIQETVAHGIPLTARIYAEAQAESGLILPLSRFLSGQLHAKLVARSIKKAYSRKLGEKPQHPTALSISRAFPTEWRSYAKFCVVRNPWEKTVSDYFWRTRGISDPPSFLQYVQALSQGGSLSGIVPKQHSNWEMYTIDNRLAVDCVIRYEELKSEFAQLCDSLSIPWDGWLPNAKSRQTREGVSKKRHQDFYDSESAAQIGRLYEKEIKEFGYSFD